MMKDTVKKIRLNIIVDPMVFPEIHAELFRISLRNKRGGGKRLLSLATLGLLVTRQGDPLVNLNNTLLPTIDKNIDISNSAKALKDAPENPNGTQFHESIMTEKEYEDFERVMNGDF